MSQKVWVGEGAEVVEECMTVTCVLNNQEEEVLYDGKSNLLDTLTSAGIDAPYSCQSGSCMACLGKILEGRVYMDDPYILSEENLKAGECLTCQAYPASPKVKVSYDNL